MRYIKDDAGNLYRTFKTPELAIKFYTEEYEKYASEDDLLPTDFREMNFDGETKNV